MKIKPGQTIEIIYQDRLGRITQRKIRVHAVRGEYILAFCHTQKIPHTFCAKNILAWIPVKSA